MHPIAERLPVHAIERSRLAPSPAFQHQCNGQDTANLRAIRAFRRRRA